MTIIALMENHQCATKVRACLIEAGHSLRVVDSYAKAIVILNDYQFDLIISDVHLENGGNVFDFLKWTKSRPLLCQIPFVLLSIEPTARAKYMEDGIRTAARTLGATKYISLAHFDAAKLYSELAELLPEELKHTT